MYIAPSHTIPISSKHRAIWYGNVLTLLHHSHIISLAYYCRCGNTMGGDKAPYHSHIIQAYCHWYGITMGGKTPSSRCKNGIWYWNDMDILDSCSIVCIWLKLQFKCTVFVFFMHPHYLEKANVFGQNLLILCNIFNKYITLMIKLF